MTDQRKVAPDKADENVECPFCKEKGFDLPGLKHHLLGYAVFSGEPCCKIFKDTEEL
jgi:hypothetical protein